MIKYNKDQGFTTLALGVILALFISGCASTSEPEPMPVEEEPQAAPPAPAPAPVEEEPEIVIKPSAPETYIVQKGDTLWDISTKFLRDPWFWPEIWYENPQIENPHLIFPGDEITLYYVGGKPRLAVNGGPRVTGLPTVKVKPQIRTEEFDESDLSIPVQMIQNFAVRPQVLDEATIKASPYIFGTQEGRLAYATGYTVYAHKMPDAKPNERYEVYHPNKKLRDPETGKVLGFETIYVGSAVVKAGGDPATLELVDMLREGLRGDILLPIEKLDLDTRDFFPRAPKPGLEGKVISLHKALFQIGQHQVGVIDLGAKDGIERGHIFVTYRRGSKVREEGGYTQLPNEKSGLMMVYRVLDNVSYGLVMDSVLPLRINDVVKAP